MPKFEDIDAKEAEKANWPHPDALGGREWGPFYNLEHVTTEFGEFGVPRGKVLYFVMGTKRFPDGHVGPAPQEMYRDAFPEEQAKADQTFRETRERMGAAR